MKPRPQPTWGALRVDGVGDYSSTKNTRETQEASQAAPKWELGNHPHQARCVLTNPQNPGCKPHGPCLQPRGSLPPATTRSTIYQHLKSHSPHQSSTCCGSAGGAQAIKVTHHGPTKHRGPLGTHGSKDPTQPPPRRTPRHEEICLPIMYILVLCSSFFFASFRG